MEIDRVEKGTIYFLKPLKKKRKIHFRGRITRLEIVKDKNKREYNIVTLETNGSETKYNYFGRRVLAEGLVISGEGMHFNENCKSIRSYRTLRGFENGKPNKSNNR